MPNEFQPYVGPRPYKREEEHLFFGRDCEADNLVSLIIAHSVLLLHSQSGAGKTSLINAKLVPMLIKEGFEILPVARVRGGLIPKNNDSQKVSNLYVFNTIASWTQDSTDLSRVSGMTIPEFLERKPQTDEELALSPRVVIFDQFEELFTAYPERWKERGEFFKQVGVALEGDASRKRRADPLLRIVFAMRDDYIAELAPYADFLPEKLRTRFRLERLRTETALTAVKGPLQQSGCTFAEGVAEKLVDELLRIRVQTAAGTVAEVAGEFIEPVQLQVICANLWRNLPPHTKLITSDHLQKFGDVNEALKDFYEEAVSATVKEARVEEQQLRNWFKSELITAAETRGTVFRDAETTGGLPNEAVDVLENRHLIRAELRSGARWYELTHDRMVEPVQASNQSWRRQRRKLWQRFSILAAIAATLVIGMFSWTNWTKVQKSKSDLQSAKDALKKAKEVEKLITKTNASPAEAVDKFSKAIKIDPTNANLYNSLGIAYRNDGNESEAINAFKKSIQLDRTFPYPYGNLADIYLKRKDYTNAIAAYEEGIRLAPDDEYPVHGLASVYRSLTNNAAALRVYLRALTSNPTSAVFHAALADEYLRQTNYSAAATNYEQAIKLDETNATYFASLAKVNRAQTNNDAAITNYRTAIRLAPGDKNPVEGLAEIYYSLGDYKKALQVYEEAVDSNPSNAVFRAALADEYWRQTNYSAAATNYEQAIKNDAGNDGYYISLAKIRKVQTNYDAAIANYEQAIKLAPTNAWNYAGLGEVYRLQERYTNAIAQYQKAVDLKPEDTEFRRNLAELYVHEERLDGAIAQIERSVELDGKETSLHLWLGDIYTYLGRYGEATNSYAKAAALEPKSSEPYRGLARVYSDTGQRDKAIAAANWAIGLELNNATNYQSLGQIHLDYAEFSDAILVFKQATALDPTNSSIWFDLGNAYWFSRRTNDSEQAFSRAKTNDPADPDAYYGMGYVYLLRRDWTNAAEQFEQVVSLVTNGYQGYFSLGLVRALEGKTDEARPLWERGLKLCRPTTINDKLNQALLQIALGGKSDDAEPGLVELRKLLADNRPPGLLQYVLVDAEFLGESRPKLPGIELAIKELRQARDRALEKRANPP